MKTPEQERKEQERINKLNIMHRLWDIAIDYGQLHEMLKIQGHDSMLPEVASLHQKALDVSESYDQYYFGLYGGK